MEIILTDNVKRPSGKSLKKGTRIEVTNEYGLKLIDQKKARPLNFVEKAVKKTKEKIENAKKSNDDLETT